MPAMLVGLLGCVGTWDCSVKAHQIWSRGSVMCWVVAIAQKHNYATERRCMHTSR
jgi:hypothetical protein